MKSTDSAMLHWDMLCCTIDPTKTIREGEGDGICYVVLLIQSEREREGSFIFGKGTFTVGWVTEEFNLMILFSTCRAN